MADTLRVNKCNAFFDPRSGEFDKTFSMRIKKKKTKSRDRTASGLSGSSKGKRNSSLKIGQFSRNKDMRASMSPNSSTKKSMNRTLRDDFMKSLAKKTQD
jgi:hypothetical protein